MDYYAVLGIAEDADEETIRRAFRVLARRYHPDAGAGSSTLEFQRAREAYETLIDATRRRRYDRQLGTSRTRPVVAEELIVSRPPAEPLFDSRRAPGVGGTRATITPSPSVDRMFEELLASLADDWWLHASLWTCRRRR